MTDDFILPEFDLLNSMGGSQKIIVVGAPGQGKSWFVRDLMYTFSFDYPVAKIFSGSEIQKPFYRYFVDEHYIVPEYDAAEMKRFIHRQTIVSEEGGNSNAILVFDDCNKNPKIFKSELFYELMQNSRHWGNKTIIAVQHPRFIAKEIVAIASWIVLYKEDNDETVDQLYKLFGGATKSKKMFKELMASLQDHECIVINNADRSAKYRVFYYCPRNRDPNEGFWWNNRKGNPVKFGCKEFREWARVRNNPKWKPDLTRRFG